MGVPKPKFVLRIGVTGHRPDKFGAPAQQMVRRTLEHLFQDAADAALRLHRREAEFLSSDTPEIRIVSALAEGADRVVAEAGLNAGFTLDAILPFPAKIYETDFRTAESREEFYRLLSAARARFILPGTKSADDPTPANRAYETVGLMTLRQCDVIIAIWDGDEASGRGGTESIVQHALASGTPVLRFDAQGNGPFFLQGRESGGTDAGVLAAMAASGPVVDGVAMAGIVEHLCAPPLVSAAKDDHQREETEKARRQLRRFLKETERRTLWGAFSYPLLLNWLGRKKGFWRALRQAPYQNAAQANWAVYHDALSSVDNAVKQPINDILVPRFAWADSLANCYGQLHRSGYVSNFVMAATAVALAVFHVVAVELLLIGLIAIATYWGVRNCWHERWLDYRQLSILLRHLRAFSLTGSSGPEMRTPHISAELQSGPQWVSWYYRMTAREIGVLDVAIDEPYLEIVRAVIGKGEVEDQIAYHRANARTMKNVGHCLEWLGYASFLITLAICTYEVGAYLNFLPKPSEHLGGKLAALTAIFPAIGAALFGIRLQGDFEGSATRSEEMARRLATIAARLKGTKPVSFAELSALSEQAANIMAEEVGDWSFVYRGRPLTLPS